MDNSSTDFERLAIIGELAREAARDPLEPELHREGRNRLLAVATAAPPRKRGPTRILVALAFAAAAGASSAILFKTDPLRYEIVGGSDLESAYVSAPEESPVDVRFSDGSDLHAEPGSRLRVDETYANGARVLLEKGATSSHVAHRARSNWTFVAGPFEVRVVGTRFDLKWDPSSEEIDLRLREGSVEVRSPLADGPIVVRAGQRFQATMVNRSMTVTDAESAARELGASDPSPAAASERAAPPSPGTPTSKPSPRRESWQDLLAHGEFESVVSAANARGLDSCATSCSSVDLRSLADAARYTARIDLADKCLLALRKRFPGTSHSSAAAFFLGRTHESQNATAQRWYETYLSEAPDGEFAADALAGKMRLVATAQGSAAAKPLALDYLRRYPQGVHVKTARKIAGLD